MFIYSFAVGFGISGDKHHLFEIPVTDILAVERLEEESFKMKYVSVMMFDVY